MLEFLSRLLNILGFGLLFGPNFFVSLVSLKLQKICVTFLENSISTKNCDSRAWWISALEINILSFHFFFFAKRRLSNQNYHKTIDRFFSLFDRQKACEKKPGIFFLVIPYLCSCRYCIFCFFVSVCVFLFFLCVCVFLFFLFIFVFLFFRCVCLALFTLSFCSSLLIFTPKTTTIFSCVGACEITNNHLTFLRDSIC